MSYVQDNLSGSYRSRPLGVSRHGAKALRVNEASLPFAPLRRCATSRRAFTLVELSVSVGILALMLALAAVVFKWTLDSTGQAKVLIDINERLRTFEATLREDLRGIDPRASLMLIQTSPVNAYWTRADREVDDDGNPLNGGPHPGDPQREFVDSDINPTNNPYGLPSGALWPPRADILMLFTSRPQVSYVDPTVRAYAEQVVYGHVDIGELNAAGALTVPPANYFYDKTTPNPDPTLPPVPMAGQVFDAAHTRTHPIPAHDWILARRNVLISDTLQVPPPPPPSPALSTWTNDLAATGLGLTEVVDGVFDLVDRYVGTGTPPVTFSYPGTLVNLAPSLTPGKSPLLYALPPLNPLTTGVVIPYSWYTRSRLDATPPAAQAKRLGAYMLPNCASFKVEWTCIGRPGPATIPLDQMLWFDMQNPKGPFWDIDFGPPGPANPERLQTQPQYAGQAGLPASLDSLYTALEARFVDEANAYPLASPDISYSTPIWYANDPYPERMGSLAGGPDPYFPTALRITIDVYDANNRLSRPVRHVMVLPVGEQ
jgi:prepilin-type N-terminal cleavage/methylation domain-containing protein